MRIALCQINTTVGDLAGNVERILRDARRAAADGCDLAVFPELAVTGYPPQDLLDRPAFLDAAEDAVAELAAQAPLAILVGAPTRNTAPVGKRLFNDALLIDPAAEGDRVVARVSKTLLPTYDVFDEVRYFEPSPERAVVDWRGVKLGVHICEDMWNNDPPGEPWQLYAANPIDELGALGADVFINLSASPFAAGKPAERRGLIQANATEWDAPYLYVNAVGANTELIFDGDTQVVAADGTVLLRAADFQEDYLVWDWDWERAKDEERRAKREPAPPGLGGSAPHAAPGTRYPERIASIHDALVLGVRDYVRKTGDGVFSKALVGLSGGIDSAVTCALAVEALGAERVVGVTMPSAYSSEGSVSDSEALADALGVAFHRVSIRPAVDAFTEMLEPLFAGTDEGVAEENIQARARGLTLMALSNKFGYLLLTTGNKSEMAVGYATLYGDMSGGLAVISDVFKEDVYRLAEHVNARAGRELIPRSTITKPPSAELRPGQQDSDSLPPYSVLDAILERYIERHESPETIVQATGFDAGLVRRIADMVDRNEYKRRQAAPGLRVSGKAFGVGRRLPIVMQRTAVARPD